MSDILWVTSCTPEIYEASTWKLFKSFFDTKSDGEFFLSTEGAQDYIIKDCMYNEWPVGGMNLALDDFLNNWLNQNLDIIPKTLGGLASPCDCPDPYAKKASGHKTKDCPHTWFNRNMSRWFRKIATLNYIMCSGALASFDYMIWIDSDCKFSQKVTYDFINKLFNSGTADFVYLKGPMRQVAETGFIGFNVQENKHGITALKKVIECYTSGTFRKLYRWDDSYVIQKMIINLVNELSGHFSLKDIATNTSGDFSDVFPESKIGEHIAHYKGRHGRELGIMK